MVQLFNENEERISIVNNEDKFCIQSRQELNMEGQNNRKELLT